MPTSAVRHKADQREAEQGGGRGAGQGRALTKKTDSAVATPEQPDTLWIRALAEHVAGLVEQGEIGRPTELRNVDKLTVLLSAITEGMYPTIACSLADLDRTCLHNWRKKAEHGYEPAIALFNAIEKAEAFAEFGQVRNVRNAGKLPQFWAASATHLERRFPDRWGKRNDDQTVAKVIFQLGAKDSDITIINTSTTSNAVNVIDNYQTQTVSEGITAQSLAGGELTAFAGEGEWRKPDGQAKGLRAAGGE